jgi:hypothetical protein
MSLHQPQQLHSAECDERTGKNCKASGPGTHLQNLKKCMHRDSRYLDRSMPQVRHDSAQHAISGSNFMSCFFVFSTTPSQVSSIASNGTMTENNEL